MFDSKEKFNIKEKNSPEKISDDFSVLPMQGEAKNPFLSYLNYFQNPGSIAAIAFILILALGIFSYFIFIKKDIGADSVEAPSGQNGDINNSAGILPDILSNGGNGAADKINIPKDLKAEDLLFGHFYKEPTEDCGCSESLSLGLPINVKTDVANYYDVSRKINLDSAVQQLSQEGFAALDNPFSGKNNKNSASDQQADDFYGMYNLLGEKEIPLLITGDFLIYYYQNVLKQVYKDIERDVFYNDLWRINKSFYEIANSRYRESRDSAGIVNDPVLEGQRMEAAYFAVAMELLKPDPSQISAEADDNKFSAIEAEEFEFNSPAYLKDDIEREIRLIMEAKKKDKSSIFLYARDYQEFKIPQNYEDSAKLRNFYLAAKWMNSVFPLHYADSECQDCLLDKDDWAINMIAACLITKDFFDNQDLKNQWAKIYKVISFFSGLRSGLTYLHYQDVLVDSFGGDYDLTGIFALDNPAGEENLAKLREKIAKYEFSEIEGGINRVESSNMPSVGMRMLQQSYWPDDYIFSRLINPSTGLYLSDVKNFESGVNLTNCKTERPAERCGGFGLDVINLIYPIGDDNDYFRENTNYQNYAGQSAYLKNQLKYFNVGSWHSNSFWATLSIAKSFLEPGSNSRHPYESDNWQNKNIDSSLAAWVNLRLPADELISGWQKEGGNLGLVKADSDYNYVEPDIKLAGELAANARMLLDALLALEVIKEPDPTCNKLNALINKLEEIKSIIAKELSGEQLGNAELEVINNFAKQFVVAKSGAKNIELPSAGSKKAVVDSIEGVKLLALVYNYGNKKVFAVGPIFNYQER
ncbi:DUF3160 domain-containing protein [Patescibacteria group bacterium]|nr:DUF3160 domain-containing protein [Patescibacteria group bacterium]MBU4600679.1 DUF3160 domain-containing protein [Patescibacteria group bacterium]MCG2698746.1 DUF3160 domain-containing protein [Candidatus Parcubacteria bacterium]